jgi:hypothetical protein
LVTWSGANDRGREGYAASSKEDHDVGAFCEVYGSHLSTESEAANALGSLIVDPKFADISGRYFDGTKEILSSAESRDESKAKTVWEQARILAELTAESHSR